MCQMWQIVSLVITSFVLFHQTGGRDLPSSWRPLRVVTPIFNNPNNTRYTVLPKGTNREKTMSDGARMPGTNWCGKGFRADAFSSLGSYSRADRCCRQHDLGCPESIPAGGEKYGLQNMRFHAIMHCTCDERFRSCLGMARSRAADIVGKMFFNVIRTPCFVFTRKKVCTQKTWWGKCIEHSKEKTAMWRNSIAYSRF